MKRILIASSLLVFGLACKPAANGPTIEPFPTPAATPTEGPCDPCTAIPVCAGWTWSSDGQVVINDKTGEQNRCGRPAPAAPAKASAAKKAAKK